MARGAGETARSSGSTSTSRTPPPSAGWRSSCELPDAFLRSLHAELRLDARRAVRGLAAGRRSTTCCSTSPSTPRTSRALSLCVERRLMVSARAKPLRSIDRLRESVRRGETLPLDRRAARPPAARPGRGDGPDRARLDDAAWTRVEDELLANRVGSSRAQARRAAARAGAAAAAARARAGGALPAAEPAAGVAVRAGRPGPAAGGRGVLGRGRRLGGARGARQDPAGGAGRRCSTSAPTAPSSS